MTFKAISIALSLMAGTGIAHLANAQSGTAPPQAEQSATEVSDADLALFLKASNSVETVRQEYQQELQTAENAEQAQKLQQEANETMINAVESFGFTLEQFNQIATAIQTNPGLAERVQKMGEGR